MENLIVDLTRYFLLAVSIIGVWVFSENRSALAFAHLATVIGILGFIVQGWGGTLTWVFAILANCGTAAVILWSVTHKKEIQ